MIALVGLGCTERPAKPYRTKAQRTQDAEIAVSKTPVPRTYRLANGELHVIDVPAANSGWVVTRRCFLWRDQEFRQASLSCLPPDDPVGDRAPEQPGPRD